MERKRSDDFYWICLVSKSNTIVQSSKKHRLRTGRRVVTKRRMTMRRRNATTSDAPAFLWPTGNLRTPAKCDQTPQNCDQTPVTDAGDLRRRQMTKPLRWPITSQLSAPFSHTKFVLQKKQIQTFLQFVDYVQRFNNFAHYVFFPRTENTSNT